MPNHIANILILKTNHHDIDKIMDDEFSFGKVVPEPTEQENYDWYSWRCENWGTKWDAYEFEQVKYEINQYEEITATYHFNTAWSPPDRWLAKVAWNFPNTNVELYWADEDLPSSGWIKYTDRIKSDKYYSHSDPEAVEFLRDYFPDKYNFYQEYIGERNNSGEDSEQNVDDENNSTASA